MLTAPAHVCPLPGACPAAEQCARAAGFAAVAGPVGEPVPATAARLSMFLCRARAGIHEGKVMQTIARRWWVPMLVGVVLMSASGIALAANEAPQVGPSWVWIVNGCVGVIACLVGAYAKGLERRIDDLEKEHAQLRNLLLREYHSKSDGERLMQAGFETVRAEMHAVRSSVDHLRGMLERRGAPA